MKVQITIRGRRYTVRSDEDDIDLQRVASWVDSKMAEMAGRSSTFDEYTIAMLAALNIASEFERFKREVDRELVALDREISSAAVLIEASTVAEAEGEE
jgi:cell division protein ZapA